MRNILFYLGALLVLGCKGNPKTSDEATSPMVYSSVSGDFQFGIKPNLENDSEITLIMQDSEVTMQRIPTTNGTKYIDKYGRVLWLQEDRFQWGTGDSTIVTGMRVADGQFPINNPIGLNETYYGSYVGEGYDQRDEGYDWVGVRIIPYGETQVRVSVRSRVDLKKASCTFDDLAIVEDDNSLVSYKDGSEIHMDFFGDTLKISVRTQKDRDRLYFYCSGGGSLIGDYFKIQGQLDSGQVDPLTYGNYINYGDNGFWVTERNGTVEVEANGLEIDNGPYRQPVKGETVHSEVGDLDGDGYPEVYIYQRTDNGNSGGMDLIAFAVNNGKSMSGIFLPPISDNGEASEGYMGGDSFAVVEGALVRRFPYHSNQGIEGTKQIQYRLVKGEANWLLEVDKIVRY